MTQTKKVAARESIQALRQYGANIIGINLTKYPHHAKNENYYSHYYNDYYSKEIETAAVPATPEEEQK
jgi:Mrp family chromosome partitioning ATPase